MNPFQTVPAHGPSHSYICLTHIDLSFYFIIKGDGMNAIRVKNGSIADGRKITVNKKNV
jgi:hypothetical protein